MLVTISPWQTRVELARDYFALRLICGDNSQLTPFPWVLLDFLHRMRLTTYLLAALCLSAAISTASAADECKGKPYGISGTLTLPYCSTLFASLSQVTLTFTFLRK